MMVVVVVVCYNDGCSHISTSPKAAMLKCPLCGNTGEKAFRNRNYTRQVLLK